VTLSRELRSLSLFLGIYENLMKRSERKYQIRENIPNYVIMLNGAVVGVLVWTIIFPSDVVKSHIQAYRSESKDYQTVGSTVRVIYNRKGICGFFSGIVPCLFRAFPVSAASFTAFELSKRFLERMR